MPYSTHVIVGIMELINGAFKYKKKKFLRYKINWIVNEYFWRLFKVDVFLS